MSIDVAHEQLEASSKEWIADAREALRHYLETHKEFHANDFWRCGLMEVPEDPRALGPVVTHAMRHQWMEKTGEYRGKTGTGRPGTNTNPSPQAVYRSLLCK